MFETNFSGHDKILGSTKKLGGSDPECHPVATGLSNAISEVLQFVARAEKTTKPRRRGKLSMMNDVGENCTYTTINYSEKLNSSQ